jgi:hypothetical protein
LTQVKQFFLQWNCSTCTPPVTLGRINCSEGCLWDVASDPSEYNELSRALPGKLAELRSRHASVAETLFNPDRTTWAMARCHGAACQHNFGLTELSAPGNVLRKSVMCA